MKSAQDGWAVVVSAPPSILRTADGGLTWDIVSPPQLVFQDELGVTSLYPYTFFTDALHAWVVLVGEARPVWRTTDGGSSWLSSEPVNALRSQLFFVDNSVGWMLSFRGEITPAVFASELYQTTDGGATWEPLVTSQDTILNCIDSGMAFADHVHGWITGTCEYSDHAPSLLATSDGGMSWMPIELPPASQDPSLFENPNRCYAPRLTSLSPFGPASLAVVQSCGIYFGEDGTSQPSPNYLYTTTDAGRTWQTDQVADDDVTFISADSAWLAEETERGQRILHSADGGAHWDLVKTVYWRGPVFIVNDTLAYAVASPVSSPVSPAREPEKSRLVRSTNGCHTWEIIEPRFLP